MSGAARWKKAFQDIKEAGIQNENGKKDETDGGPRETKEGHKVLFDIDEGDAVITGVEDETQNDNVVRVDIEGGGDKEDKV